MKIIIPVLASALLFVAAPVAADEAGPSLESVLASMASTPEQHAALASHYRAKAEAARAEASRHQQMARSYSGTKLRQQQQLREHCDRLAQLFSKEASEYDALAAVHAQEAGQ